MFGFSHPDKFKILSESSSAKVCKESVALGSWIGRLTTALIETLAKLLSWLSLIEEVSIGYYHCLRLKLPSLSCSKSQSLYSRTAKVWYTGTRLVPGPLTAHNSGLLDNKKTKQKKLTYFFCISLLVYIY